MENTSGVAVTKSTLTIDKNGILKWRNKKGQFHRESNKPAVIRPDGTKLWYVNGKRHRDSSLPAIICSNGQKEWWVNGLPHRDNDKPAIIYPDGYKEWWVNREFIKESYN